VQKAHAHGVHACVLELAHPLTHLVFVERGEHLAVGGGHALPHREAMPPLGERPRLPGELLLEREVEGLLVTGDVDDVAEAFGGQHSDLGAGVGEDDVRGDGRPVQEVVDLGQRDAGLRAELLHALDDGAGQVVRGRGDLVDCNPSGFLVDEDEVGERAADIDADALHAPSSAWVSGRTPLGGRPL
jgi:hypothetical protein